jgi:hypothetical protein
MHADGREALTKVANDVEDEHAIGDDLAQVTQGIGHGLELAVVAGDGEITLHKIPEGGIEVEATLLDHGCQGTGVLEQARRSGQWWEHLG